MTEEERVDALACALGVAPAGTEVPTLGIHGTDGRVYSWLALTLAHVETLNTTTPGGDGG